MSALQPIFVIGSAGQIATALRMRGILANCPVVCRGRTELDLTRVETVEAALAELRPAAIINAAAYTAVDRAETNRHAAFALNADGPGALAALCAANGIPLVHISTDFVFDGEKGTPYAENDPVAPLGIYGASKAAGEAAVRDTCSCHVILRTAWVYSGTGQNFMRTMLRLGAERDTLTVVDDQQGAPTYADDIAAAIDRILSRVLDHGAASWGTYHLTNAGRTTWHGFAKEIFRLAAAYGLKTPRLLPIPTSAYPTLARRPRYSVLDNARVARAFGVAMPPWEQSLAHCFDKYVFELEAARA